MSNGMKVIIGRHANDMQIILDGENIVSKLGVQRLWVDIVAGRSVIVKMECYADLIEIEPEKLKLFVLEGEKVLQDA